ncbi:MAG: ABC transporter permease [Chloroflexi bacterium]|nr:ABC transporter permease [Chloroflexota bacterium]
MPKIIRIPLSIFLVLHGFVHLMGTVVSMQLATLPGFAYKTTVLAGQLDLGVSGMWIFGLLWLLAGIGTAAAGVGLLARARWTRPALLAATVLSLVICVLDWEAAKMGGIIDIAVLAAMVLALRQPASTVKIAGEH